MAAKAKNWNDGTITTRLLAWLMNASVERGNAAARQARDDAVCDCPRSVFIQMVIDWVVEVRRMRVTHVLGRQVDISRPVPLRDRADCALERERVDSGRPVFHRYQFGLRA